MHRIDVHRLADEATWNRFHTTVLVWCFVIIVFDGYDLAVGGIALPNIMKDMAVDATQAGFMLSSALFGMMFGAMGLGWVADRYGRRVGLSLSVLFFSVFTAAAGFTSDPVTFSVMRFLAGLGIGGAIPAAAAQITEYSPKKVRGMIFTVMTCGYAVGSILAAVLGKTLIDAYGWQTVFIAAGLPVLLIPFIMKYMPESLPFLIKHRDDAHLREVVGKIRPGLKLGPQEEFLVPDEDKAAGAPVARLFQEGRGFSTAMFWIAYITCLFMLYALSSWLVKLMAMAGYSLGSALNFLLAFNSGAIVGAIGGGWLSDKLNIKWVLFCGFLTAAVSLTALGYGVQPLLLVVAVVGASTLGTQILAYAYTAQFYPAAIRSTGVGFASGIGRFGAIAGPIGIGVLVSLNLSLQQNFMVIAAVGLVGAVAVALINHRRSASTQDQDTTKPVVAVAVAAGAPATRN
ncbi:MFS transporter [Phreatobacter stygius]|uniref:MFS transporter n=1 Tax=Phreatobacter stygius TaxID=1940610 RepID=A0A4D7BPM1_9HYPH|nr:MFS transporter [Phreatobacter stygius]